MRSIRKCVAISMALALVFAFGVFTSLADESKPSLEGAWELTSAKWTVDGQEHSLPGDVTGSQIKMYSKGHFLFVGQSKLNDKAQDNYGGGTYSLKGDQYTETLLYHVAQGAVGKTLHFRLELKGKTLTLTGPINPEDQKTLGNLFTEVYVKKD